MKAAKVRGLEPAAPFAANAARIVATRLGELRGFAPEALSPGAAEAQHDMRIAAKRLRYVLEVGGFCFGEPAASARRTARELQDLLGEIHDCDVMLPRVEGQIAVLREEAARVVVDRSGRGVDLEPRLATETLRERDWRGLELLAIHLTARRAHLCERFAERWGEAHDTWELLEAALGSRPGASLATR